MRSPLSLCTFLTSQPLIQSLQEFVGGSPVTIGDRQENYILTQFSHQPEFVQFVEQEKRHIDCLILQDHLTLPYLLVQLHQKSILLPALILVEADPTTKAAVSLSTTLLNPEQASDATADSDQAAAAFASDFSYHNATLRIPTTQLDKLDYAIDRAVSAFLQLSTTSPDPYLQNQVDLTATLTTRNSLMVQQCRLAEKLKERLGYLGVYYKRNPQNFLRNMTQAQRQEFIQQLRAEYREIILSYFSNVEGLNEKIDNLVNLAFFADIAVSQIVEIHMGLMDEFSKQLKLEGRSDEVLLDYRLTLIDTLAHLCEMYRRSIPRES